MYEKININVIMKYAIYENIWKIMSAFSLIVN